MISEFRFLCILTGIPGRILRRLSSYELFKISELAEPFFQNKPYHEFIIKSIANDQLLSPKPKLKNVSFGQFIFADTYFCNFSENKNKDDLNKFIASLYLPHNTTFKEKYIEQNFNLVNTVDAPTLQAITINYQLIREWLTLAYPLIFFKSADNPSKIKQLDSTNWIKVIDALVGDDVVNHDRYAKMPLHNVFRYMSTRIKENIKRKK